MKQFILAIFIISTFVMCPLQPKATTMPCSMVLEPIHKNLTNAKETALVRLSYSKTEKLGPIILKGNIKYCK